MARERERESCQRSSSFYKKEKKKGVENISEAIVGCLKSRLKAAGEQLKIPSFQHKLLEQLMPKLPRASAARCRFSEEIIAKAGLTNEEYSLFFMKRRKDETAGVSERQTPEGVQRETAERSRVVVRLLGRGLGALGCEA